MWWKSLTLFNQSLGSLFSLWVFVVVGWICLQRRPEVDWSNKNTCLPSNSNSWEMLNMKYHFYMFRWKQLLAMCWCDSLFGAMVVERVDLFAPLSGRLITDKHQMGQFFLARLCFFFIFFQKPNQSSNTNLEEISSGTTKKPFDSIILRIIHCFEFTET